jgi:AsmA family protein
VSKRRRRIFGALAAVAVILIGVLILFDWNWLKGTIESQVAGRLGRPLLINGDLDVELSPQPKIIVERAELGNAPWGSDAPMAKIDRAEVTVDLLKLLRGEIVLPEVRIAKPALLLETRPDGPPNWQFGATKETSRGRRPCRGSAGWRSAILGFATTISAADGTSPPSCRASLATPTPPSS